MEEEVGFEPTERSHVRRVSRPLRSTALALLHLVVSVVFTVYQLNIHCQGFTCIFSYLFILFFYLSDFLCGLNAKYFNNTYVTTDTKNIDTNCARYAFFITYLTNNSKIITFIK